MSSKTIAGRNLINLKKSISGQKKAGGHMPTGVQSNQDRLGLSVERRRGLGSAPVPRK